MLLLMGSVDTNNILFFIIYVFILKIKNKIDPIKIYTIKVILTTLSYELGGWNFFWKFFDFSIIECMAELFYL